MPVPDGGEWSPFHASCFTPGETAANIYWVADQVSSKADSDNDEEKKIIPARNCTIGVPPVAIKFIG
jgi:hypothetical protein